jgi:putative copper resistance protein D
MEATLAQVAATAVINISLAWIAGVLAARSWLTGQAAAWHGPALARLSSAISAGLAGCAAGLIVSLWTEAALMGELPWLHAWPAVSQMLRTTHYGHAGAVMLGLLVVAMVVHWRLRQTHGGTCYAAAITLLLLMIAAVRVSTGHAYEHGALSVAAWVAWLHLALMSLWAGVVFVAAWLVLPRVLAGPPVTGSEMAAYLTSMSNWAGGALLGILATGAYNAWRVLGSPRDLVQTDYGLVLAFKVCLVVLAIALGAFNKFVGLPAALAPTVAPASSQRALRTIVTALRIESVVLLLVIVAAAFLTGSAPPG